MAKQRERLNCPNCGMPIVSDTCEYCGTKFFDFANIDINGESYLRVKINDRLYILRAICKNASMTTYCDTVSVVYGNNYKSFPNNSPNRTLELTFDIHPDIEVRTKECEKNV